MRRYKNIKHWSLRSKREQAPVQLVPWHIAPPRENDEVSDLAKRIAALEEKGSKATGKDIWDKFDVVGKFVSSVLLVTIGGVFTYFYNSSTHDKEAVLSQQKQKTYELDTVAKFLPYMTNEKEEVRRTAVLIVQRLVGTEVATQLALVNIAPDTAGTLVELRGRESGASRSIPEDALKQLVLSGSLSEIRVFFATDRAPIAGSSLAFGNARAQLAFGKAHISIPSSHRIGNIESPSPFRLEFAENPQSHLVLTAIDTLSQEKFFDALGKNHIGSRSSDIVVYIHGWNVSFSDAAKRIGQMAFDLGLEGPAILYSWPSQGSVTGYLTDQQNAQFSAIHLAQFLEKLRRTFPDNRIHVISHSTGAVVLGGATNRLMESQKLLGDPQRRMLDSVALISPDLDADIYAKVVAPELVAISRRVTSYAWRADKTLAVSEKLTGAPRAGGGGMRPVPNVETIEIVGTDSASLSLSLDDVLRDLFPLIRQNLGAAERPGLKSIPSSSGALWQLTRPNQSR